MNYRCLWEKLKFKLGSKKWAGREDIDRIGLGDYETDSYGNIIKKNSGIVCGINPYNNHLMLYNGSKNILVVGPEGCGKGVGVVIPTGLMWENSAFFFDVGGETWHKTSKYRKDKLGQRVLKFEPLCSDGSSIRWNPLAEINIKTLDERSDVMVVSETIIADNRKLDVNSSEYVIIMTLNCIIFHLLYMYHTECKQVPSLNDIVNFLAIHEENIDDLFNEMYTYNHISVDEFFENNVFEEIYGEYIHDFSSFNKELADFLDDENLRITNLSSLKNILKKKMENAKNTGKKSDEIDWNIHPYNLCLTHPLVVEWVAILLKQEDFIRLSIFKDIQSKMALYQDPVIKNNISCSDFAVKDLINPDQAVSLYFVMKWLDVQTLRPLAKLLINLILNRVFMYRILYCKCIKQRLLLMLDDFRQLGYLRNIESYLFMSNNLGINVCIIVKDIHQLDAIYSQDNFILDNCRLHIYYTPNLDPGKRTIMTISKMIQTMTPDDTIAQFESYGELIVVAGEPPIRAFNVKYYDTKSCGAFFMDKVK